MTNLSYNDRIHLKHYGYNEPCDCAYNKPSIPLEDKQEMAKSSIKVVNRDFLEDLPGFIRDVMWKVQDQWKECEWFEEAWNKYRDHVLESVANGKMPKAPGYIFDEYIDDQISEDFMNDKDRYIMHSDEEVNDLNDINELEDPSVLEHHGVKGMRWGFRKYQNEDGTLTEEGKKRYKQDATFRDEYDKNYSKAIKKARKNSYDTNGTLSTFFLPAVLNAVLSKKVQDVNDIYKNTKEGKEFVEIKKQIKELNKNKNLSKEEKDKQLSKLMNKKTSLENKMYAEYSKRRNEFVYNKLIKEKFRTKEGRNFYDSMIEKMKPEDDEKIKKEIRWSDFNDDNYLSHCSEEQKINKGAIIVNKMFGINTLD